MTALAPRAALALAGGVLGALSLPPWGWWPLAIVGLACFAAALHDTSWRRRTLAGAAFGLGLFGIGLFWVTEFHAVGFVILVFLETVYLVAGAALTRRTVLFPATIVLAEALRGAIPFGGLPLGGLALGQAGGPFVAGARIGGSLLVLGIVAALAAALVEVLDRNRRGASVGGGAHRARPRTGSVRVAGALAAGAVAVTALGWIAPAGEPIDGPAATIDTVDAVILQGGGPRGFRAVDTDRGDVLDAHLDVSRAVRGPRELVLWPENTIDVDTIDGSGALAELAAEAERLDATVVAGVTQDNPGPDGDGNGFENTAVAVGPNGEIVDRYTKVRRVPFGEYVPLRGFLSGLVDLSVLPRDAVAGTGTGLLRTDTADFAVAISYEVFFADRTRSGVRAGGEIVLVPTNAASFTTSQVPTQQVAAARLRAWETGRWVLQAGPTGYSAVIDERGRVRSRSTLGRAEVLTAEVPRRTGLTLHTRSGNGLVVALALAALVLPGIVARMRGSRT